MPQKNISNNGITITAPLQRLIVGVFGLSWLAQVIFGVYSVIAGWSYGGHSFIWYQALYILTPVLMFGVAYWYVGTIGSWLNRNFKAMLIAVVGFVGYGLVDQIIALVPGLRNIRLSSLGPIGAGLTMNLLVLVLFVATLVIVKVRRSHG